LGAHAGHATDRERGDDHRAELDVTRGATARSHRAGSSRSKVSRRHRRSPSRPSMRPAGTTCRPTPCREGWANYASSTC
jgi:hypothetical protein